MMVPSAPLWPGFQPCLRGPECQPSAAFEDTGMRVSAARRQPPARVATGAVPLRPDLSITQQLTSPL